MKNNPRIRVGDRVTIFPRGAGKIWCADFWFDGEHRRQSLGTRNKKIAVQRAVKLDHDLTVGTFRVVAKATTIGSAIEDYLGFLQGEGRARKTTVRYTGELQAFRDFCGEQHVCRLVQVNFSLFDSFRADRQKVHAPRTVYHESVVVVQFLKWCASRDLLVRNPLAGYKLEKPPLVPRPGPSLLQVQSVLDAASPRRKLQLALLAFTGMRSGELQRLRRDDVDLEQGWIHVESRLGAETKTRESRKIPIHPALKGLLATNGKSPGPWYFTAEPSVKYPNGDHVINTKTLNDDFVCIAKKLKLPNGRDRNGYTIHSLRHFFETFCVNNGIPQRVIDTWLGHRSDKSMAAVYYRLSDEESQTFMARVPFSTGTGVPVSTPQEN